jgi:D-arginine dehydrogenase
MSDAMEGQRILIIGGGVAGLAAAWQLALRGARPVVLEREPLCCTHSSGRNAAIFRHAEPLESLCALALRSRALCDELIGDSSWLDARGALYTASEAAPVEQLERAGRAAGVRLERRDGEALRSSAAVLRDTDASFGLFSPDDGVIDIHAITSALFRAARDAGAHVRTRDEVRRVTTEGGRVTGVELSSDELLEADGVVIAGGAWAADLGEGVGAPLPLLPLRRHLTVLDSPGGPLESPVVWRLTDEVYFRPEVGGVLASPCDEEASEPCLPPTDPDVLEVLAQKLASAAPSLAGGGVRRLWACLRTFAPDRNLVVGRDPRVAGLAWLAGLGGHGMTLATGAAELLAAELDDERAVPGELSPARLVDEDTLGAVA